MCTKILFSHNSYMGANHPIAPTHVHSIRCRTQVPVAPKIVKFPQLPKQGIPYTDQRVRDIALRQSQPNLAMEKGCKAPELAPTFLAEAYERCRIVCAEYAKTFYLG